MACSLETCEKLDFEGRIIWLQKAMAKSCLFNEDACAKCVQFLPNPFCYFFPLRFSEEVKSGKIGHASILDVEREVVKGEVEANVTRLRKEKEEEEEEGV